MGNDKRGNWKNKTDTQQPIINQTFYQRNLLSTQKTFSTEKDVVNEFNNIFIKIGPKLAEKIQSSKFSSESFGDSINTKLLEQTVLISELNQTKVRELMT